MSNLERRAEERSKYEIIWDNYVKAIKEEKQKPKPDKALLKRLAKEIAHHEEHGCDFTGGHNDKKPTRKPSGKRCYKFGKWITDDEREYS